jgi:hypothetical protein
MRSSEGVLSSCAMAPPMLVGLRSPSCELSSSVVRLEMGCRAIGPVTIGSHAGPSQSVGLALPGFGSCLCLCGKGGMHPAGKVADDRGKERH